MTIDANAYFTQIAANAAPQPDAHWLGPLTECDYCDAQFEDEKWMIDGVDPDSADEQWGNACAECAKSQGFRIGRGHEQLYQHQGDDWVLVAGGNR